MKDPLFIQVQKLLKLNSISFDKKELEFQIQSHPSYPSLHAITGVLDHFGIENIALDVPKTKDILAQLPESFLAQIKSETYDGFATIKTRDGLYDIYKPTKQKKETLKTHEFLKQFTGVLVVIEKENNESEAKNDNSSLVKTIVGIMTFGLFAAVFIYFKLSLNHSLFLIFSLIGLVISMTIINQELGKKSVIGNAFCGQESKTKSCDDILNSSGAVIFKNFKLSDLSLVYFSSLIISILLLSIAKLNLSPLFLVSLFALPITLFSIYYQYKTIKKWCALCLGIVSILWMNIAISGTNLELIPSIHFNELLITALSFSFTILLWYFIKPLMHYPEYYKNLKVEHYKFKRNFNLFNSVLKQSKYIDVPKHLSNLVLGNSDSTLELSIITNPFCGHCKAVHIIIENILSKTQDIKINIVFNVDTSDISTEQSKVSSRILELNDTNSQDELLKAFHDIYEYRNANKWLQKWGNCKNQEHYFKLLKQQRKWCLNNSINFTPELLINGKSYPTDYQRKDLLFFIEDLQETTSNYNLSKVG